MRHRRILAIVGAASMIVTWGTAESALATVTSAFDAGTLTVMGDDRSNSIRVGCGDDGNVNVNHRDPDTGSVLCSTVTAIAVVGGGGNDFINLHGADEVLLPSVTNIVIDGGAGGDDVEGSNLSLADAITGAAGRDYITADLDDLVDGGDGNDVLDVSIGGDIVISDASNITAVELLRITGSDEPERIDATAYTGNIDISGHEGADHLVGGSGQAALSGGDGKDELIGGPSNDRLSGGKGNDTVTARAGNDFVNESDGADDVRLGAGNDGIGVTTFSGDEIRGGPGRDRLETQAEMDVRITDHHIVEKSHRARLSSIEFAQITAQPDVGNGLTFDASRYSGNTFFRGGLHGDVMVGGSGRDEILGSSGDDRLAGGAGRDKLFGDDGTDICDGGPGSDRLVDCESES